MPEMLPLPLDTESFNTKRVFRDRARVPGFPRRGARPSLSCPPAARDPDFSPSAPHAPASERSRSTFLQPLVSSSCQSTEIEGLGCKAGARGADSRGAALRGLPAQRCCTGLLPDFRGTLKGEMRCRWQKVDCLIPGRQGCRMHRVGLFFQVLFCLVSTMSLEITINYAPSFLILKAFCSKLPVPEGKKLLS